MIRDDDDALAGVDDMDDAGETEVKEEEQNVL